MTTPLAAHPYGRHAVLLPCAGHSEVHAWLTALERAALREVVDVVAGERSVVVVGDPARTDAQRLAASLAAVAEMSLGTSPAPSSGEPAAGTVEIPTTYDGEDLTDVALRADVTVAELVRLHSGQVYEVAFCGFAPGFAYLVGTPPALHLPRRDTPRPRVPAGSVAVAAGYSAVYPHESPGGWWLLGRTDLRMFDADREPPSLLRPGMRVRFVPVNP